MTELAATVDHDPLADGLELVEINYRRAAAASDSHPERFFRIGDHVARLRFAGDALVMPLTRAIAHLEIDAVDAPGLTVDLWDSESTSTELSPLLGGLVDLAYEAPCAALSPRYELRPLQNERVSAAFDLGSGILSMFDSQQSHAYYWMRDAGALPYYEHDAPLRTLLNWWVSRYRLHCAHAAAVSDDRGAILLTGGKGGSGKSTTALACLNSDLRYASDDYCVISATAEPYVYSLYSTAKLRGAVDLARQPGFQPWIANPDPDGDDKLLMFLQEHVPDRLLLSAPLRAMVLSRVVEQEQSALHEIPAMVAFKALAPTTMF